MRSARQSRRGRLHAIGLCSDGGVHSGWEHIEAGEENAPSHIRASLMSPQVLVPIRDGRLALGTWQGIFFCEFDGPRSRKVYVSTLR